MTLITIDGDEARFILPDRNEYRVKMDQLSDEDQTWIRNHHVEIEKRNLHDGEQDATRADDMVPLRFVRWHYEADERGISGDFQNRDSRWVEIKNNTRSPHAIFEEIARQRWAGWARSYRDSIIGPELVDDPAHGNHPVKTSSSAAD